MDHVLRDVIHLDVRRPDVGLVPVGRSPPPFGHHDLGRQRFQHAGLHKRLEQRGQDHRPARARAKLKEDLRAAAMDLLDNRLDRLEHLRVLVDPLFADDADQRDQTRDKQTDVVIPAVTVERLDAFDKAAFRFPLDHVRTFHGQHDDAVFDFDRADLPRLEQGFVDGVHRVPPKRKSNRSYKDSSLFNDAFIESISLKKES